MVEGIGVFVWMAILIIWYRISEKMSKWLRYLFGIAVFAADIILAVILIEIWKLTLMTALVVSGVFFLSEYFPKGGKSTLEITQRRRIEISVWEDYFFVVGATVMGIELFLFLSSHDARPVI